MRLHQFAYSPFAAKVRKCLELKGLAFEVVNVPYADRRALVALTGGTTQIPVLEDGARVMDESARITAYLDETYPRSLREDPLAVVIEGWADNVLEDAAFRIAAPAIFDQLGEVEGRADAPALFRLIKERKFGPGCLEAWRASRRVLSDRLAQLVRPIEQAVAAHRFVLGTRPSLADAAVYGQLFMLETALSGFVEGELPAIAPWFRVIGAERA